MIKYNHFLFIFSLLSLFSLHAMEYKIKTFQPWSLSYCLTPAQPIQSKTEVPHFQVTLDDYNKSICPDCYAEYQEALKLLKTNDSVACNKLHKLKQDYPPATFTLWCYYDQKKDKALASGKRIKRQWENNSYLLNNDYPSAQMELGLQYIQINDKKKGLVLIEQAAKPRKVKINSSLLLKSNLESDQIARELPLGIYTGFYYHHPAIIYLATYYLGHHELKNSAEKYVSLAYQVTGDPYWLKALDLIHAHHNKEQLSELRANLGIQ